MASVFIILTLLLAAGVGPGALAGVDYCFVHNFRSNSSWLQFTKEMSSREYFVIGAFKSLHCCAKGYRSIEWYKDGRPYPWPGSFILYPEAANQTVYSPAAQAADAGNYSCLVRNDTAEAWHHTALTLVAEASSTAAAPPGGGGAGAQYWGRALPTYAPRDQVVRLGDDARFFCEAFIGRVNLPDAYSAIWWRREIGTDEEKGEGQDQTPAQTQAPGQGQLQAHGDGESPDALGAHRGLLKKDTSREDEQIVGVFLEIRGVRREDLGQYTCFIHGLDNQRVLLPAWLRLPDALGSEGGGGGASDGERAGAVVRRLLIMSAFTVVLLATGAVLALRFGPELRLALRDALARRRRLRRPEEDGPAAWEWDALLCHCARDAETALALLQPALTARLGFRVRTCCLSAAKPSLWAEEAGAWTARSQRVLVLVSPALLGGAWTTAALASALETLHMLASHPALVVITLQAMPAAGEPGAAKEESARALRRLLRASAPLLWQGTSEAGRRSFWTALRLRLPPRPPPSQRRPRDPAAAAASPGKQAKQPMAPLSPLAPLAALAATGSSRPQRCASRESLEVLV